MKPKLLITILVFACPSPVARAEVITSPPLWEKTKKEVKTSIDDLNQSAQKYEEKPALKRKVLLNKNLNPSGDPAVEAEIKKYQVIDSSSGAPEEK